MNEINEGFKIKDNRIFTQEGNSRIEEHSEKTIEESIEETTTNTSKEQNFTLNYKQKKNNSIITVDFSGLILSLSHAAMLQLGKISNPSDKQNTSDLELARYTIDTINMLKDKTVGNLTKDEEHLIENILTELRLAFIRANT